MSFSSNKAYLASELSRLQVRLNAYIEAQSGSADGAARYLDVCRELDESRAALIAMRHRAVHDDGITIPLDALQKRFELTPRHEVVVMLCLAWSLSATLRQLLMAAQGNMLTPYMQVGFVADLLHPTPHLMSSLAWSEQDSPLVESGLIVVEPTDEGQRGGRLGSAVYAPDHVVQALAHNAQVVDSSLRDTANLRMPQRELYELVLPERARGQLEELGRVFHRTAAAANGPWNALVSGPGRSGKSAVCEAVARMLRRPLLSVDVERLIHTTASPTSDHITRRLTLVKNNAELHNAIMHLVVPDHVLERYVMAASGLSDALSNHVGLALLETDRGQRVREVLGRCVHLSIELERPDAEERRQIWESSLPPDVPLANDVDLGGLAMSYHFDGGQIHQALRWALERSNARGASNMEQQDLEAGARTQLGTHLNEFAEQRRTRLGLEHLVLPEPSMALVMELLDACRYRRAVLTEWGLGERIATGRGITALFHGEPGTGKTLCAQILASELGAELSVVNVPDVVSKWIGETEKNLKAIFRQARASNTVLLFDEADALFGKRVKVERAQDHHQNVSINVLLQEIEQYDGVSLLTTNQSTNLDPAFERRILFKIDFPKPDIEQRSRIWEMLLPRSVPRAADVSLDALARDFELTGGQIKNAILRAAYRCRAANHGLQQAVLRQSCAQQIRAAGGLVRDRGLDW